MSESKPIKSAVIGVGYLGTFHAQKQKQSPAIQLLGVCDFNYEQAQKVAASLDVSPLRSPQEVLARGVEAVTIAASTQAHYDLVKFFLQNKVSVNVEKPLAATAAQAAELIQLANKNGLKLGVGHIERFNPVIGEFKKELKNPKLLEFRRFAPFRTRGSDVNVLYDLMIHDIDLMFWLLQDFTKQSEPDSFSATGQALVTSQLDVASAVFTWSGVQVHIHVSRVHPQIHRGLRAVDQSQILLANTATQELEIVRKNPESVQGDDQMRVLSQTVAKADALQLETEHFAAWLRNKQKPVVTGEDGLRALEWVEKIEYKIKS